MMLMIIKLKVLGKLFREKNTFFLCYAGSSKGLNEITHLKKIDKLITNSNENIKVLYRPIHGKSSIKMRNFLIIKILKIFFRPVFCKKLLKFI